MPDESTSSAHKRFARDLRRIREQRGVSLSALQEATQVPVPHLEAFESGTVYEQSRMNTVYLKAFVQAYAEALELPPDPVVNQLEAAEEGDYENQLAVQFLEESPSVSDAEESPDEKATAPGSQSEVPLREGDHGDREGSVKGSESGVENPVPSPRDETDGPNQKEKHSPRATAPSQPSSDPGRSSPSGPGTASLERSSVVDTVRRVWNHYGIALGVSAAILFLVVLLGVLANVYFGGGGASTEGTASVAAESGGVPPDSVLASDTVDAEPDSTPVGQQRPPADVTLGDTLYVAVEASTVVAGMRVQQDDDLRRPYWIEAGDAEVFPFTRRITFENQLDSLRLFLENYPYPTTRTDDEGRVVISRDTAEQFVDTLRGPPATFPRPVDTVDIRSSSTANSDTLNSTP